jgi:hypothetical protein
MLRLMAAGLVVVVFGAGATPASAMSMKDCGALYRAAEAEGTLGGQSWNGFRKSRCADTAAAPAPATVNAGPSSAAPQTPPPDAGSTSAVFPTAIAPAYAKETPRKARFKTCVDQYRANKATGGNAGLKWVEKNGGYYSQCTRRLKAMSS